MGVCGFRFYPHTIDNRDRLEMERPCLIRIAQSLLDFLPMVFYHSDSVLGVPGVFLRGCSMNAGELFMFSVSWGCLLFFVGWSLYVVVDK